MLNRCKITNISSISVVIEDMGVYLPGRGDSSIVNADILKKSRNILDVKGLIRIDEVKVPKPMPVWPFHKPEIPEEEETPRRELGNIEKDIRDIKKLLAELLSRPSAPPAEVVAAHLQVARERRELLKSGTLPLAPEDPMFIPSTIVPDDAEAEIKASETEVIPDDFDGSLEALKRALKK
jgi:hypothetical protein